jgi:hypothetical protein
MITLNCVPSLVSLLFDRPDIHIYKVPIYKIIGGSSQLWKKILLCRLFETDVQF